MRKNGNGNVLLVLFILVVMIGAGAFFAYKSGYFKVEKEDIIIDKNEIKEETTKGEKEELSNSKLMELYEEKIKGQDSYALSDLNNDGIVELITHKEETSSDKIIANYTIYSYVNEEVTEIGKIPGRKDNNLLYKMNNNTILSVYGHMGYEIVKTYEIENDKLVEKTSIDRQVPTGENYTRGDEYIPFDFISDTIQFEMYR